MSQTNHAKKWTGVEPIQGYGQSKRVFKHLPKRDAYAYQQVQEILLPHPQTKGFDRFGLDCLSFLARNNVGFSGTPQEMADDFERVCQGCDNVLAQPRVDYEELRMLAVFAIPAALWFVLFSWLNVMSWAPVGKILGVVAPLFVGWRLHRKLADDLDDSVPNSAIYATTFLTRNGLTREDIQKNPLLISEGIRISESIQQILKYQICQKINNYRGILTNHLPKPEKFQIPSFPGASFNPYWGEYIRFYNGISRYRNRGITTAPMLGVGAAAAAATAGAYAFDTNSMPDFSQFNTPIDMNFAVPDYGSYATGIDNFGLPQVNIDGTPMIANTGIDIHGAHYGNPHEF